MPVAVEPGGFDGELIDAEDIDGEEADAEAIEMFDIDEAMKIDVELDEI